MSIFKTLSFQKWQKKEKISDELLRHAVIEIERGLLDADLGGGLVKKRIPRNGSGKSSGYRTLLATNRDNKWFFIYGFAKNERDNISTIETTALKQLAKDLLSLSDEALNTALQKELLKEIE